MSLVQIGKTPQAKMISVGGKSLREQAKIQLILTNIVSARLSIFTTLWLSTTSKTEEKAGLKAITLVKKKSNKLTRNKKTIKKSIPRAENFRRD
jgi:hypothetical protein